MLNSLLLTIFSMNLIMLSFMIFIFKNPIHSLLYLILVFVNSAGLLMSFNFEFISLLLIIIYVGAIAVLFLFILMMLDITKSQSLFSDYLTYIIFGIIICGLFLFLMVKNNIQFIISSTLIHFDVVSNWVVSLININNCFTFGHILYSYYMFFFLLAGLILLLALIGAIVLTHVPKFNMDK